MLVTEVESPAGGELLYDVSAFEDWPAGEVPWDGGVLRAELARRAAREKARRELIVHYYRIGHALAFPLPLETRPEGLPPGIPGDDPYPWSVWLAWALEERWRTLQAASHVLDDAEAGTLFRREVLALAAWADHRAEGGGIHLATGHWASSLGLALADTPPWPAEAAARVRGAGAALLERDLGAWLESFWPVDRRPGPRELHNIPFIVLARAAALARALQHPLADTLAVRTRAAADAWLGLHAGPAMHTEGPAYDGYLLDAVGEWLAADPERDRLLGAHAAAVGGLLRAWTDLALPGRPDLLAPLGDVEPEMCFHATAMLRLAAWSSAGAGGLGPAGRAALAAVRRFPPSRLPAAALVAALRSPWADSAPPAWGAAGPAEHRAAVSLRTGWTQEDALMAAALPRTDVGHLHPDAGHVVFGWAGRFWITDPGYQQYRAGVERDYTLGEEAHNAPRIGGAAPRQRAGRLLHLGAGPGPWQRAAFDLSACYGTALAGARVRRDVWLHTPAAPAVALVRDRKPAGLPSVCHWHGGGRVAWAFRDGWARLSDGRAAVWFGTWPGLLDPQGVHRHEGSRGPLTLTHADPGGAPVRWWALWGDAAAGWQPPAWEDGDPPRLRLPGGEALEPPLDAE